MKGSINPDGDSLSENIGVRLFRNRRRWFYAAVTISILLSFIPAWNWWYRAMFPVPDIPDSAAGIDLKPLIRGMKEIRWRLAKFKYQRETSRLQLKGTVWKMEYQEIYLIFDRNGKFRVFQPFRDDALSDPKLEPLQRARIEEWTMVADVLNNRIFQFLQNTTLDLDDGQGAHRIPNLIFESSDWGSLVCYDGKTFSVSFFDTKNLNGPFVPKSHSSDFFECTEWFWKDHADSEHFP